MSLYGVMLCRLRQRLLDPRRFRFSEGDVLGKVLEPEHVLEARSIAARYEEQLDQRLERENPRRPEQSVWGYSWGGNALSIQREFNFYNRRGDELTEPIQSAESKVAKQRKKLDKAGLRLSARMKLASHVQKAESELAALQAKQVWARNMAASQLKWMQWEYERRLTDDDRRYLEPPHFPITDLEGIPQPLEHWCQVIWPGTPAPFRKGLIDVVDQLIAEEE